MWSTSIPLHVRTQSCIFSIHRQPLLTPVIFTVVYLQYSPSTTFDTSYIHSRVSSPSTTFDTSYIHSRVSSPSTTFDTSYIHSRVSSPSTTFDTSYIHSRVSSPSTAFDTSYIHGPPSPRTNNVNTNETTACDSWHVLLPVWDALFHLAQRRDKQWPIVFYPMRVIFYFAWSKRLTTFNAWRVKKNGDAGERP